MQSLLYISKSNYPWLFLSAYNSKSVLYYVVQCPTQLVGATAYKANRTAGAGNTGTPAARTPHQCPQCAQLLIHLQFFLNIAQTRNWGKKNLVKLIGVKWYYRSIVRTAAVWRIFGLNCFEVCRSAGFCFVLFFLKKKTREIKWSACVTAPLWRVLRLLKAREFRGEGRPYRFQMRKA